MPDDKDKKREERLKRMEGLLNEFMEEAAEEMIDESTMALIEKNLKKHVSTCGMKWGVSPVRLFLSGFEFAMASMKSTGPQGIVPILMGMRKILKGLDVPNLSAMEDAMKRTKEGDKKE